ncbi:MAG: hypothetical protein AAGI22_09365 [Planctomycetota bacterium]
MAAAAPRRVVLLIAGIAVVISAAWLALLPREGDESERIERAVSQRSSRSDEPVARLDDEATSSARDELASIERTSLERLGSVVVEIEGPTEALRAIRRDARLSWLGGPGDPPENRGPWTRSIQRSGEVRFDDLEVGRYRFALEESARLRFEPLEVRVESGETTRARAAPVLPAPTEIVLRVRDRSGQPVAMSTAVLTVTERRPSGHSPITFQRRVRSADVTLRRDLFPGRYDVVARFGSSSSMGVLPRRSARASFEVREGLSNPKVEVDLAVSPREREAFVRGRIALGPGELPVGFRALGTSPNEGAVETALRVAEDGTFLLRADLDHLAGPQIELRSRHHTDTLGPFTLAEGAVDLGVLRFRSRREEPVEVPTLFDAGSGTSTSAERSVTEFYRRRWDTEDRGWPPFDRD